MDDGDGGVRSPTRALIETFIMVVSMTRMKIAILTMRRTPQ
jgi:hypothetical protein